FDHRLRPCHPRRGRSRGTGHRGRALHRWRGHQGKRCEAPREKQAHDRHRTLEHKSLLPHKTSTKLSAVRRRERALAKILRASALLLNRECSAGSIAIVHWTLSEWLFAGGSTMRTIKIGYQLDFRNPPDSGRSFAEVYREMLSQAEMTE